MSHVHLALTHAQPPTPSEGSFVTIDEPVLAYRNHPESLGVSLGVVHSLGLDTWKTTPVPITGPIRTLSVH